MCTISGVSWEQGVQPGIEKRGRVIKDKLKSHT